MVKGKLKKLNSTDRACVDIKSRQGKHAGYNVQVATDDKHGLIVNSDVVSENHDWNQWQVWAEGRKNDDNRIVWKSSPLADIQFWRSPVLLIHGDDDHNVPFSETIWLVEKLAKQGVDYELLVFPDDVHSFLLHSNWVKAFKAAASFFDRKLKNKVSDTSGALDEIQIFLNRLE